MSEITRIDQKILVILQANARVSLSAISRQIHLSRTAVEARIKKMEAAGVIEGYKVELAHSESKHKLGAIISLKTGTKQREKILAFIKKSEIVIGCYSMTGSNDLEILVRETPALKAFSQALWEREETIAMETKIVLKQELLTD